MKESLIKNQPYFTEIEIPKYDENNRNFLSNYPLSKFNSSLILLINQSCFSACLDFIDEIKILSDLNKNKIIIFGQETVYDSNYMEIHKISLSIENISFTFPMKFYRNRKRKSKENLKKPTNQT